MFQSDEIAVANQFDRIGAIPERSGLVEFLDEPAVVAVLVGISRHLLLLSSNTSRIEMHMRM